MCESGDRLVTEFQLLDFYEYTTNIVSACKSKIASKIKKTRELT